VKAAVYHRFGSPDVLELQDIDQPALTDDGVLVRVRASSVNPAEWYAVTGRPYIARTAMGLRRPRHTVPGADFAGTVEAVGDAVTDLRPGDAVLINGASGGVGTFAVHGPLRHVAGVRLASLRASQKVVFFVANFNREDFLALRELLEAGTVTPVIDRQYELAELPAALRYLGGGHARAKVVVTV
jgi:NADPH:quinone reductase-like Zn-dependent oxidoreductase